MDSLLKGIPGVTPFFNDVLISAPTAEEFATWLNFYHTFLPQKSAVAEPLHWLLDRKASWVWGRCKMSTFRVVKDHLVSNSLLEHFDESLLVVLTCNASPYSVDVVLSHQMPDGWEVPAAYYSHTLSLAKHDYAQINKEGLAIVAGVKKSLWPTTSIACPSQLSQTRNRCWVYSLSTTRCPRPSTGQSSSPATGTPCCTARVRLWDMPWPSATCR